MASIEDSVKEITLQALSAQILAALDSDKRDALLERAIKSSLTSYDFKTAVEKIVADEARGIVAEMMKTPEYQDRIRAAIRAGFDLYEQNLVIATEKAMQIVMHGTTGKNSYYEKPGRVLNCWPDMSKE